MQRLQVFSAVLFCLIVGFNYGEALRCWTCSSDMDAPCADHFNTTRLNQYSSYQSYSGSSQQVQLLDCEGSNNNPQFYPQQNQRPVCMKKKQTTYGRTTYIRQCRFLHYDEKVGTCPTETTSSATTIDFCEYCDYDGCNNAVNLKRSAMMTLALALVPLFGAYVLIK